MAKVGKNISKQRIQQGMTQDTLAEKLHVSRQTVSNYETGKSYPDIDMLVNIAEVLNVEIQILIYGEVVKKKQPMFDSKYLKTDVITSGGLYFVVWFIVWSMKIANGWSPWDNIIFNLIFSAGIVGLHIFIHWLIGVYEKRYNVKEEIIYAGLTNTLEFVITLWIIRSLWFVHRLMEFPQYYITLFFGIITLVEIGITFIRYKGNNKKIENYMVE